MNLQRAVQRLRERGLKVTPQRMEILKAVMRAGRPVTAREVTDAVRARHPRVSVDTVYRNLTVLTRCGLISPVNLQGRDGTRFEYQGDDRHHHHFVCVACGRSFCVEWCPTATLQAVPSQDPGFRVLGHAFEVYGYCSRCQKAG
ncbi:MULTISPECIES: Fur family transcriptional regulator [Thermaerobacter]|uniref:Fe2+/Zn2+ uptake regulation protein n=1 Tax=Thermaerobacter subterraneus DSM 13965 TaxID=867903 RepID=K6QCK3_9FIRM|nr:MULTISPECIES: Fur family transcriptional regulator [Thermaerobacter]EKP94271.1 Fe2+/Zn2+ uptake regulation protein [Thermaerobacter subterraneus DSM 13965]QIA26562.1 transcriptional repressor [Thermaerobacter sp. PB12/4term]